MHQVGFATAAKMFIQYVIMIQCPVQQKMRTFYGTWQSSCLRYQRSTVRIQSSQHLFRIQVYRRYIDTSQVYRYIVGIQMYRRYTDVSQVNRCIVGIQMYRRYTYVSQVYRYTVGIQIHLRYIDTPQVYRYTVGIQIHGRYIDTPQVYRYTLGIQIYLSMYFIYACVHILSHDGNQISSRFDVSPREWYALQICQRYNF